MIPLAVPNLKGNEELYLKQCVDSTFVSSVGPFVDRFEQMVADLSGASGAVATASGTAGLHAALTAVGVEPGSLVILPAFTFIASANAIHQCGAAPWLFDITEDGWGLSPEQVEKALVEQTEKTDEGVIHKATGKKVCAMMPVHTLGHPADISAFRRLADQFDLPLVVDGAASLGAEIKGNPVGSLAADLTVFSFNGNKTFTAGAGGAVVGNDQALCNRVRHLTTTAKSSPFYDHDEAGFNYRMSNLQAAVGCAQLECFDEFLKTKRSIADIYDKAFQGIDGVLPFPEKEGVKSAKWFSGLVLPAGAGRLEKVVSFLNDQGIGARPFWKPMTLQNPYRHCLAEDMTVTDNLWDRILTLPCSTSLGEDDQNRVIEQVKSALGVSL